MLIMSVLDEVYEERQRQIGKGYVQKHDDGHPTNHFTWLIQRRVTMIDMNRCPIMRKLLIEVAALAVAAVESMDRKQASE